MANTYKVLIMGKEYTLTSEDNKDYTEKLAAALDKRIKDMRAKFTSLSITDCAVLTALDCMDELGQSNRNIDNIRTQIKDYVDDAGRARSQAAAAQRENKALRDRVEQLEKELRERTNFDAMDNVGESVSAEDILRGDIAAAIGDSPKAKAAASEVPEQIPMTFSYDSKPTVTDGAISGGRMNPSGGKPNGGRK